MIAAIRAEFRKLLTIRSTYFIVLISLVLVGFFAGFIEGFRNDPASLHASGLLASESTSAITFVGLILAFAGLLLMGHEYRYNTIMYTLTAPNRRIKVIVAKFFVVSVFAIITSLLVAFFSPLCTIVGAHLHGHIIGPQVFNYWNIIWRCLFCGWGYAMYALILITIIRSQVGAIVTFLLIPLIGEGILRALLKENSKYLPFMSLQGVAEPSIVKGVSIAHDATTVLVYVALGLVVGTVLFVRRDAN
jgi:ABC-type transport system involved in multi-copper enzyme maturation permease subunit